MGHPRVQLPQFAAEFFRRFPGGRRRLLALTYRFNVAAFEHSFAQVLTKMVQVDIISGEAPIRHSTRCRLWRAKWPGTFHPKLLLLLSNDRAAVGLGSANMTSEGIGENLETWAFFEHKDDGPVMSGIRRFLERLDAIGVVDPVVGINEFVSCLPAGPDGSSVLSTLEGTLLSQASARLSGPVARLDVVSPISADPSELVSSLRQQFSVREIRLFTNRPAPAIEGVDQYWVLEQGRHSERRLGQAHSKMFAFHRGQHVDLFWGSANLSCAAWLCKGKNANVELLVHSLISEAHWQGMLRSLPENHTWSKVSPGPPEFRVDDRVEAGWGLLHGTFEAGELHLIASGCGLRGLKLRTGFATVSVNLTFQECEAAVPKQVARKLGFTGQSAPNGLDWRLPPSAWQSIPINALDRLGGAEYEADLAGSLFEMYSGRNLPQQHGRSFADDHSDPPGRDDQFDEEKELTRSLHQGELDQFVLKWRLVVRAIGRASTGNDALRACRIHDAVVRITKDAIARPTAWPQYRQRFVKDLLENSWHG